MTIGTAAQLRLTSTSAPSDRVRRPKFVVRVAVFVGLLAGILDSHAAAATVTNLRAESRRGQTFITFTESSPADTYRVYRSASPITSLAGLTPIAGLAADSSRNRYTGINFVICDRCPPVADNTGLLVWTPRESGRAYYGVQVAGSSTFASVQVDEVAQLLPGAVLIEAGLTSDGLARRFKYWMWEDYATWHPSWGYYGHYYDVYTPTSDAPDRILLVSLHAAGEAGWRVTPEVQGGVVGVYIFPRDNEFASGLEDPYTGGARAWSMWFGYRDPDTNLVQPVTERRIARMIQLVRDDPQFLIDPTRVYVIGASLGAGAMHMAAHYPELFAAAAVSVGWPVPYGVNSGVWAREGWDLNMRVGSADGPTWANAEDLRWSASQHALPPITHTFRKDDVMAPPTFYPDVLTELERYHQTFASQWMNGGHNAFFLEGAWGIGRFKTDEAYPAFARATDSTAVAAPEGQRNLNLDWGSSLHPIGEPIEDVTDRFGITLRSLATDVTADVTIRNVQHFRPMPGDVVGWRTDAADGRTLRSGSVVADAQGLVTMSVPITTSGNRVTLTCAACSARGPMPARPRDLRVR